jgi:tyrosyl-tRNA synthetase
VDAGAHLGARAIRVLTTLASMSSLFEDLEFRGLVHQVTDPELRKLLDGERLTGYIGFDPTADSLHVGHLQQLCLLRRLQMGGHQPIAVAGGGTAVVGDPGGKSEERSLLDDEQIKKNLDGIRPQMEKFFDFSPAAGDSRALLVDNGDWLRPIGVLEFLRDVGKHFTVNQMVTKESVRARLERPDHGISFTEFTYMLLQAYDFLHLYDTFGCRLQLGGSDQWGNITMGIELIRKVRRVEAYGLTSPLVVQPDGTKFGKTESGTVWLDANRTSAYQLFQFFLRVEDTVVCDYLRRLTFLDHDTIRSLDADTESRAGERRAQRALARAVCSMVHGDAETERAEKAGAALFSEEIATLDERTLLEVFAEVPTTMLSRTSLDGDGLSVVAAFVEVGLSASRNQARSAIGQGGAYINNRRVEDPESAITRDDLLQGRYVVLRRGRRDYHLVRFD